MDFDYDRRDDEDLTDEEQMMSLQEVASSVSAELPGEHRVDIASFDRATGNPAVVVSTGSEGQGEEDFVRRALDHVQRIGPVLGLAPQQPPEFLADPNVQRTSSGGAAVQLRQQYKGLEIYDAGETVRFDPTGRLTEVAGRSHTVVQDRSVDPALDAGEALRIAAFDVASVVGEEQVDPFGQSARISLDVSDFAPSVQTADPSSPERRVTFDAEPFSSASVELLWFPLGGDLVLAWQAVLHVPAGPQYRVIVDASDGDVVLRRQLTRAIVGSADIFVEGGGSAKETSELPIPIERYGVTAPQDLPPGEPAPWLLDATTAGANVKARTNDGSIVAGQSDGTVVRFSPAAGSTEELVVHLFAFNGVMHDVLYALGFREQDGNFQVDNRGRGGFGTDRVDAIVHPGPVWGTANMGTPADGLAPVMNMGLVASTGRHTALDADVVFHEYAHGLSNRLVGGPLNTQALDEPQSGGMGEGWGDYFACILNRRETVGAWVVDRPGGIRAFPYDENFPDTFANVGNGRYTGVHALGEIWCATLMELNRRIGTDIAAQLVIDGMKLSVANPGFLAMRDAILVAARDHAAAEGLDAAETENLTIGVWEAFARFGMGPAAASAGATLGPVQADFTVPARTVAERVVKMTATPGLEIPDADPRGVLSALTIDSTGIVAALSVSVSIRHTYRGDLVVRLRPPGGDPVVLHNRNGGSADDLEAVWESSDGPLAQLLGQPLGGDWQLEVFDLARWDTGVLEEWSLEAQVADARPTVGAEDRAGVTIPDDDPTGITRTLDLVGTSPASHLELDLDITHTYIGDLIVELRPPSGPAATLHDREGGSRDNLIRTYDSDSEPMSELLGRPVTGEWQLHVSDRAGRDIGKLNSWRLTAVL